jgi:hypothetical protein
VGFASLQALRTYRGMQKGQHRYMLTSVIFVTENENHNHFGGATGTRTLDLFHAMEAL